MTGNAAISAETMHPILGIEPIMRRLYENGSRSPLWNALTERTKADPADAAAWLDLSFLMQGLGQREQALRIQMAATTLQPVYRRIFGSGDGPVVAAFMTPGDLMANTPVDFLLQGSNATLLYVYLTAESERIPDLPALDAALLAIGPSDENSPVLRHVAGLLRQWQGPAVMNGKPDLINRLTRDGVATMLASEPTILAPATAKVSRKTLNELRAGPVHLEMLLPGCDFPLVVRPHGTHAGAGMARIARAHDLAAYLAATAGDDFFLSPFINYSDSDGLFRKQRIVFIGGRAFPSHLAVSEHWIVHYLSAGMLEDAERRREEEEWMETFESDFAKRHEAAFTALSETIGLDYFGIDCAETRDGRLLLFEADVAMIVHDMDSEAVFPYKKPAMRRLFSAFQQSLLTHGARSANAEG